MSFKDFSRWNTRAAVLYALGAWTMIGSLCYYRYMGYDVVEVKKEEEPENPNEVVHTTPHSRTVLVYKDKDFVPYSTRIYNMFNPSSPSSSSSSSFVHESGGAGEE